MIRYQRAGVLAFVDRPTDDVRCTGDWLRVERLEPVDDRSNRESGGCRELLEIDALSPGYREDEGIGFEFFYQGIDLLAVESVPVSELPSGNAFRIGDTDHQKLDRLLSPYVFEPVSEFGGIDGSRL